MLLAELGFFRVLHDRKVSASAERAHIGFWYAISLLHTLTFMYPFWLLCCFRKSICAYRHKCRFWLQ